MDTKVPGAVLETLQQDVADIKVALLGNDYNSKGLLKRTEDLEESFRCIHKRQDGYEQRVNRIIWTGVGVGTAIGIVWAVISQFINYYSNLPK